MDQISSTFMMRDIWNGNQRFRFPKVYCFSAKLVNIFNVNEHAVHNEIHTNCENIFLNDGNSDTKAYGFLTWKYNLQSGKVIEIN